VLRLSFSFDPFFASLFVVYLFRIRAVKARIPKMIVLGIKIHITPSGGLNFGGLPLELAPVMNCDGSPQEPRKYKQDGSEFF
jgi:hypothetical protein